MAHINTQRQSQVKLNTQLAKDAQELAKIDTNNEEPSDWLINELKESEKDRKKGHTSPAFDNAEDAIAWLNDPNAKYEDQI